MGKKKEKKKKQPVQPEGLWQFSWCCLHYQASNEELSKIHLAFDRERRHEVSVSIRLERQVISGVRPTDQHRSAGTTFSGYDDWLLQLTRSYSATCTRSSQLQRWDAAKRPFSFRFQKALPVYCEIAHAWRKTQKNVLVWSAILHVVELRVLVYSRVHLKFTKYGNVFFVIWPWRLPELEHIKYSEREREREREREMFRKGGKNGEG